MEEAPLRLDGSIDWGENTRWHFEPGGFRPLAKQTCDHHLLVISDDHLGTPHELFDEAGRPTWTAALTTSGVVRDVKVARASANGEGQQAIFPRPGAVPLVETHDDLSLKFSPERAQYDCPIRFQGQWADEETGLYYNRFRYYDPSSGQYLAPDPIKLDGGLRLNGYVDTPTILTDPLGLSSKVTVADGKWDWVFGRVNADRSRQIAGELAKIGIKDDPEGRSIVIKALNQAVKDGNVLKERPTPVGTTSKMLQGQITGPGGTIDMEAGFEVKPNGDYSFTTLIPKS